MVYRHSSHLPIVTGCVCSTHISESTYVSFITQDADWVQFMARADNATQIPSDEPVAVILELPEELKHISERPRPSSIALAARDGFVKDIRNHISNTELWLSGGVALVNAGVSAWKISEW